MTLLSRGNKKLDRGTYIYSHTPIVGCSKNCKDCAGTCYANNQYLQYKQTKIAWDRNFELSKTDDFIKVFNGEIAFNKVKLVRLFQSGDVYDMKFLKRLERVIKDNPQTFFYGYTKNEKALRLNKYANCNMIYSFIEGYRNYGSRQYCELLRDKFGAEICELDESKGEKCMRDCTKCQTCSKVCFVIHGKKKTKDLYEQTVIDELKNRD